MRYSACRVVFCCLAGLGLWFGAAPLSPLQAQILGPAGCGNAGVLPGDAGGFTPLPRGDLFCFLLADPKDSHSFATYQVGSKALDTDIGAVGIGDSFGFFRVANAAGDGMQLGLSGSVFAQFDLRTSSFDLINADYLIGFPLTFRYGGFSGRARVYHQSSHLGDEFLLREPSQIERENLSFESVELLLSQEVGPWRAYAGGEYLFRTEPDDLEPGIVHGGVEFRQIEPLFLLGRVGSARLVAALDTKLAEEQDWEPGWSARAGAEVGRGAPALLPVRRWYLLLEAYRGPSPYGQFYTDETSYVGLGIHFSL